MYKYYTHVSTLTFWKDAKAMTTGKLIVIDGTDGSGKGTQTELLVKRLREGGYPIEFVDFPQYGQKSAGLVEDYLNGRYGTADQVHPKVASIFYACDRFAASQKIWEWLTDGKIVIANRYTSSNMGHQAGKIKDLAERDEFLKWLEELEFNIFKIPKPNLNILLYVNPEIGQRLVDNKGHREYVAGQKRDIHEADLQHLIDAAEAYRYVAQKYVWTIIDCVKNNEMKPREEIHELIWNEVLKNLIN